MSTLAHVLEVDDRDLDVLVVDDDLDALVDAEDDRVVDGGLEAPPSCTCTCGPGVHGVEGGAPPCLCPAPGLRTLLDLEDSDQDDEIDDEVLSVKLAASLRAARLRARTPEIVNRREVIRRSILPRRKRKPKATAKAHTTAQTLEAVAQ